MTHIVKTTWKDVRYEQRVSDENSVAHWAKTKSELRISARFSKSMDCFLRPLAGRRAADHRSLSVPHRNGVVAFGDRGVRVARPTAAGLRRRAAVPPARRRRQQRRDALETDLDVPRVQLLVE